MYVVVLSKHNCAGTSCHRVKLACWTIRTASAPMWEHAILAHQTLVANGGRTTATRTLSAPLGVGPKALMPA